MKNLSFDSAARLLLEKLGSGGFRIRKTKCFYVFYNREGIEIMRSKSLPRMVKRMFKGKLPNGKGSEDIIIKKVKKIGKRSDNNDLYIKVELRTSNERSESFLIDHLNPEITYSLSRHRIGFRERWDYPLDVMFANSLIDLLDIKGDKFIAAGINNKKIHEFLNDLSERYFMKINDYYFPFGMYFSYPIFLSDDKKEELSDAHLFDIARIKIFDYFYKLATPYFWLGKKEDKGATVTVEIEPRKSTGDLLSELYKEAQEKRYDLEFIAGEGIPATGELGWGILITPKYKRPKGMIISVGYDLPIAIKEAIEEIKKI